MHLSDGEYFRSIPSLAHFLNMEQELWYESKGLRVSLDLGRIQEVNLFCCFALHLRCLIYKI